MRPLQITAYYGKTTGATGEPKTQCSANSFPAVPTLRKRSAIRARSRTATMCSSPAPPATTTAR
ncbi:MAG: hypothetical protein IBGAMO2_520006 [Arenicellales bacterium IbO2]|nr:MAG: hypothetical protein IBGAMO2_520006 [Arenicellales bacterium IbO2]